VCYWYGGAHQGQLQERARAASAPLAVAWGQARTSNVRIRTAEGLSLWAGTGPRPDGFSGTWTAPAATTAPTG
jgi:hypothetical protein